MARLAKNDKGMTAVALKVHSRSSTHRPAKGSVMQAALLTVACVLLLAPSAAAKNVKVYVFAAPVGASGSFAGVPPAALQESVADLIVAIRGSARNGLADTATRADAGLLVEITAREEVNGERRVHARVTLPDGHPADLTGASTHHWQAAADAIAAQLATWVHAQQQDDRLRVEAAALRARQAHQAAR